MCLGIPGKILEIEATDPKIGRVAFGGIVKTVCLAYTPEATVGDYVIVHVGFSISVVEEMEAQRVFEYLDEIEATREVTEGAEVDDEVRR